MLGKERLKKSSNNPQFEVVNNQLGVFSEQAVQVTGLLD